MKRFLKIGLAVLVLALAVSAFSFAAAAESGSERNVGDIYSDGAVNIKDAIYLLQYIASAVSIPEDELRYSNLYVEDNGEAGEIKVNIKDAIILLQSIADMDVTLGVGRWSVATAPTEDGAGALKRNVSYGYETKNLPPLNPDFYTASVESDATCYSDGKVKYAYTLDAQTLSFEVAIPMLADHVSELDAAVEPTCLAEGLTEGSHCKWCKKTLVAQSPVPTLSHVGVAIPAKEATCTEQGNGVGEKCSVCGTVTAPPEIYPMLPHTEVVSAGRAATCVEAGYTDEVTCGVCHGALSPRIDIPALGHSYSNLGICGVCRLTEHREYTSYGDYAAVCNVSETSGVVTLTYNSPDPVGINIHLFALDPSKTYVFSFGSNAGKVKISGNPDATYGNVRISVASRGSAFSLLLSDLRLYNYNTVISSAAHTLNLGFFGSRCAIETTTAAGGANGVSGESFVTSAVHGKSGANANVAISCSGIINITCGATTYLKGGNGGNGGNGGDPSGLGADGGNGGRGGNGAHAIYANQITATFTEGTDRSALSVVGGSGGAGGSGGDGTWLGSDGSNGAGGSSATATNVSINYL